MTHLSPEPIHSPESLYDFYEQRAKRSNGDGPVQEAAVRKVRLNAASGITMRAVPWLWEGRIPLGEITLLGGREGIGKSAVGYSIAAQITKGTAPGDYHGRPKSVLVCATEDSWAHTIVPRLAAADADLDRVYRVDVTAADGSDGQLTLPLDVTALAEQSRAVDAGLLILDPLMSRLDSALDTHKDSDVRRALEPIRVMAEEGRFGALGLIHVNKGSGSDPVERLMGSRAFTAVARSVLFCMTDPDDEDQHTKLFGCVKSNLGSIDRGTHKYTITTVTVGYDTELDKPITAPLIEWGAHTAESIMQKMEDSADGLDVRTARQDAELWLRDYLETNGGSADCHETIAAAAKVKIAERTLRRAFARIGGRSEHHGYPRRALWRLPEDARGSGSTDG